MRPGALVLLSLLLSSTVASAQTYRCGSGSSAYFSDRPCGPGLPGRMGSYGAVPERPTPYRPSTSYAGSMSKAPEHLKYLGAECASINDAIRTAPARGVRGQVVSELHEEYRRKCAEEDQMARSRVSQDQSRDHQQRVEQLRHGEVVQAQTRLQADQCASMRDVISLKRKREATLNPTEVQALRALESSYNDRCLKL